MYANKMTRTVRAASFLALGLFAVAATPAHAQSCILCYTSVAGGGPVVVRALQVGILTLLVPALLLFGGVFYLIYRRAMAANEEDSQQPVAQSVARPVARRIAKPVLRPAVSTVTMPIRGTFTTTAS